MTKSNTGAFLRGFAAGLSSPYALLRRGRGSYRVINSSIVYSSWQQVGESLRLALNSEEQSNGKNSSEKASAG